MSANHRLHMGLLPMESFIYIKVLRTCHRPACQTLSNAFIKSMKLWDRPLWCCRYFSIMTPQSLVKERQPQAMSEPSHHQPNQPSQRDHAPNYPQPTQGQKAEKLLAEEQGGFRPGSSTVEQILNTQSQYREALTTPARTL